MSDTVGFVRHLPHQLVEAFRSTLEEVADSDLILHVVDGSHPDPEGQIAAVREVFAEIGAAEVPQILVLNKIDRAGADAGPTDASAIERRLLGKAGAGHAQVRAVAISALTGDGVDALLAAIDDVLPLDPIVRATLELDAGDGATIALVHQFGRVLATHYEGGRVRLEAEIPESLQRRLKRRP
jgi:GTP-binding protein HflX